MKNEGALDLEERSDVSKEDEPVCTNKCMHIMYGLMECAWLILYIVGMTLVKDNHNQIAFHVLLIMFFLALPSFFMFLIQCKNDGLLMRRIYATWLGLRFIFKAMTLPIITLILNKEIISTPVCAWVLQMPWHRVKQLKASEDFTIMIQ